MAVMMNSFHVVDYLVFALSLVISLAIGAFFALRGGKQKTQGEYLMANRQMPILPVAISIQVSFLSAILILGTPAEMYSQGAQYVWIVLGMCLGIFLAARLFVPLLYPLKVTSAFEYLELRFNSVGARLVGTFLTVMTQVLYMGIAGFAPSTALEAVTGFPVWASIVLINVVATIYTTIGGIKAVIWTDVFQSLIMLTGILAIVVQGCIKVGSVERVWVLNDEYERLNFFHFDVDPTVRHTFWSLVVGSAINWMGIYGAYQSSVQRYCSLPTLSNAKNAVLLNMIGAIIFLSLSCLSGVVVFAYYVTKDCDILAKKLVDNPNQIIPFFVMETLSYPAIPGIFLSSLYAGALSSVSSSLNAMAALMWEDVFKRKYEFKWTESKKMVLTKVTVLVFGCVSVGVSLIVQNLEGTVIQMAVGMIGSVTGPMAGMFVLGGFFPWANAKAYVNADNLATVIVTATPRLFEGAICGGLVSFGIGMWFVVGSYVTGLPRDTFPSPNGTCDEYFDSQVVTTTMTMSTMAKTTLSMLDGEPSDVGLFGIEKMYSVSYLWFSAIGFGTCIVVGLLVSFITGPNSLHDVPVKYQMQVAHRLLCCLPRSWRRKLNCYRDVGDASAVNGETKGKEKSSYELNDKTTYTNEAFTPELLTTKSKDNGENEKSVSRHSDHKDNNFIDVRI